MEKRKLSGKTILKLTGALLALGYFGFCLYAGITGKFPGMHRKQHVMRFGDLKNWVSGGMSAVMIAVFCIFMQALPENFPVCIENNMSCGSEILKTGCLVVCRRL